jgi:hypothetical protein
MDVCVADQEKRVTLPGIEPGDRFCVHQAPNGHIELVRIDPLLNADNLTPEELDERWEKYALTPKMSWEDLRKETREP